MQPIHWAAGLARELKKTGTGEGKLDAVRRAMAARFADPAHAHKDARHPDRHLTAMEAVDVLRAAGAGEVTIAKALSLAETGVWAPPKPAAAELPEPPEGPAPVRVRQPEPEVTVPEGDPFAGVMDLGADVATVGPKPVEELPEPPAPEKPKAGKRR